MGVSHISAGGSTGDGRPGGSEQTRRFYDETGWTERDGQLVDIELFGNTEEGPLRAALAALHHDRVRAALASAAPAGPGAEPAGLDLLECGCGGNPRVDLLDLCRHYTGVDFSRTGLRQAARKLADSHVPHELHQADACELPFEDGRFDALYSAHMIYHIPDPAAQALAIDEMLRVLRPGGTAVIVTANPFPVLFPERAIKRLVAITPVLGPLANRLRAAPPLPYAPMTLRWYGRHIGDRADVTIVSAGIPSTRFNRGVSEHGRLGRGLWRAIVWLDRRLPRASAWLGNYAQLTITKR